MSANLFSICIPKASPVEWQLVKQAWCFAFPDDEVTQVDVVRYKPDNALAGYCKIFVHLRVTSPEAVKARDYMLAGNTYVFQNGWHCKASTAGPPRERKPRETAAAAAAVVEYASPYEEVPTSPPPPPTSRPPSPQLQP